MIDQKLRDVFIKQINDFDFKGKKKSISNYDDIKEAVDFIYKKKAVLYRKRIKDYSDKYSLHGNNGAIKKLDELLCDLAKKIHAYFNMPGNVSNNQSNFDEFHHKICQWFLDELNVIRAMVGLINRDIARYGNAQKMINILFKYLSCFGDYPKYADLFSYCHMPIDGYIVRALKNNGVVVPSTPWNWLDNIGYIDLQKEICSKLQKNNDMPILEAEFIMWPIAAKGGSCRRVLLNTTSGTHASRIPYFFM